MTPNRRRPATPDCPCRSQPERLRRLLDPGSSEAEDPELAAHLEHCPDCCRSLDAMAARSHYWSDLRRLRDGDVDGAGLVAGHDPLATALGATSPDDEAVP